jgi:hypothetical protein
LHLPKPSLLERYTNIFFVFSLSGILHIFTDLGMGKSSYWGTMLFFQSMAFGIMIEDAAQELTRRLFQSHSPVNGDSTSLWKRVLGYAWVVTFLLIFTPIYTNEMALIPPDEAWFAPFQVTAHIGTTASAAMLALLTFIHAVFLKPEI